MISARTPSDLVRCAELLVICDRADKASSDLRQAQGEIGTSDMLSL